MAEQHDIWWDVSPGEAHWRQGRAEVTWSLLQAALNKMATLDPECPVGELFSWVGSAHNEMFRNHGASPDQVVFGRSRRPLDSELLGHFRQTEAETCEGSPAEEAMRRRMLARQAYAAAQADRQLRLAKLRRTRAYREWSGRTGVLLARRWRTKQARSPEGVQGLLLWTRSGHQSGTPASW